MGTNEHGLDVSYFEKTIKRELTDIRHQTPDCLARVFARLSRAADESVLLEPEFDQTWIDFNGENYPDNFGKYLVKSSYGLCLAEYHDWGKCFQDVASNNDEGMCNSSDEVFKVHAYKAIN